MLPTFNLIIIIVIKVVIVVIIVIVLIVIMPSESRAMATITESIISTASRPRNNDPTVNALKRGHASIEAEEVVAEEDAKRQRHESGESVGSSLSSSSSTSSSTASSSSSSSSSSRKSHQEILLLHGPKQRYTHTTEQEIPATKNDREMLVKVQVVGLNPIDWKAPDFGFGLPTLPCISGRDLAGEVVEAHPSSRLQVGDSVMGISTDYRDSRKSAYQEYAVVPDYNACRLPANVDALDAAPLGVAFVAAALALGVCIGLDFSAAATGFEGPDLVKTLKSVDAESIPQDVREECVNSIREDERPRKGDWIAIWGGSSATGCVAAQLAKLAGLKVICILDVERNGERMLKHGADLLVDRMDTARAVAIVRGITQGRLRFGLDTRGKESAALLASTLLAGEASSGKRSHMIGLTGLPKEPPTSGVKYHTVPIKSFHETPAVGEGLMVWLEKLLEHGLVATPDIEVAKGGLLGINDALDRLRNGSVNGPRIVVPLGS